MNFDQENTDAKQLIDIECPDGHEMQVDLNDHEAGLVYECEECGVEFQLPELDGVNEGEEALEKSLAETYGVEIADDEEVIGNFHAFILEHVHSNDALKEVLRDIYGIGFNQGVKSTMLNFSAIALQTAVVVQSAENEGN